MICIYRNNILNIEYTNRHIMRQQILWILMFIFNHKDICLKMGIIIMAPKIIYNISQYVFVHRGHIDWTGLKVQCLYNPDIKHYRLSMKLIVLILQMIPVCYARNGRQIIGYVLVFIEDFVQWYIINYFL